MLRYYRYCNEYLYFNCFYWNFDRFGASLSFDICEYVIKTVAPSLNKRFQFNYSNNLELHIEILLSSVAQRFFSFFSMTLPIVTSVAQHLKLSVRDIFFSFLFLCAMKQKAICFQVLFFLLLFSTVCCVCAIFRAIC